MEILSYWCCWAVGKMQYVKKQRRRDTVKALAQTVMHGWVHSDGRGDEVMGDFGIVFLDPFRCGSRRNGWEDENEIGEKRENYKMAKYN